MSKVTSAATSSEFMIAESMRGASAGSTRIEKGLPYTCTPRTRTWSAHNVEMLQARVAVYATETYEGVVATTSTESSVPSSATDNAMLVLFEPCSISIGTEFPQASRGDTIRWEGTPILAMVSPSPLAKRVSDETAAGWTGT
jgi:hypothetical protein